MFDSKTLFALNKEDKDAIVYMDANGNLIRLTRDDFSTEGEFLMWKEWSDHNFHEEENQNHIFENHTVSLYEMSPSDVASSTEVFIEKRIEKAAKEQCAAETVIHIKGRLTARQFRRLWMYSIEDMTEQAIAEAEGKTQQGISKSLKTAKNKILRLFMSKSAK